jgi:hypothetical protein
VVTERDDETATLLPCASNCGNEDTTPSLEGDKDTDTEENEEGRKRSIKKWNKQ